MALFFHSICEIVTLVDTLSSRKGCSRIFGCETDGGSDTTIIVSERIVYSSMAVKT